MPRRLLAAAAVALLLTSCAVEESAPPPRPSPTLSTSAVVVPADGVTLAELGFVHGPREAFTVPPSAVITVRVDQPNTVTLVLTEPTPPVLGRYLRRVLPPAGFQILADGGDAATLTFVGHGWTGSFTGAGSTSAVNLRPR